MPDRARSEIHEATGAIVLAQEDRFRLQTAGGRSLLLTLNAAGTAASMEEVAALARSRRTVRVRYRGEPEAGAVAVAVTSD